MQLLKSKSIDALDGWYSIEYSPQCISNLFGWFYKLPQKYNESFIGLSILTMQEFNLMGSVKKIFPSFGILIFR